MKIYIILTSFLFITCSEFNHNGNENNEKIFYVEIIGFDAPLENDIINKLNNKYVSSVNPAIPESHRFLCRNNLSRVEVTYKNVEVITIFLKENSSKRIIYSLEITKLEKDGRLIRISNLGDFNYTHLQMNQKINYDELSNQIVRNTILGTYK